MAANYALADFCAALRAVEADPAAARAPGAAARLGEAANAAFDACAAAARRAGLRLETTQPA